MSEYNSWRLLLEDFRMGYLTESETREHLEELSYDLDDEELEEAEEKLEEFKSMMEENLDYRRYLDSVPFDEEDEFGRTNEDPWKYNYEDYE
jgi:hypothetical protein